MDSIYKLNKNGIFHKRITSTSTDYLSISMEILQQKIEELRILKNPVLPQHVNIHIYELVKKGKGYSVVTYRWNNMGRMDPYEENDVVDQTGLKGYSTLTQLKKSYGIDNLSFVIDGNLFAPSKLFQVIVECSKKQRDDILIILSKNKGEAYEVLLNYKWLDEIPTEKIKELLSY